ncbi:MAG TPA: biopolymer transporter ExbD, partial [Polyangiales bacterium]|nr:biopolymer transporter ExbD [Polyangiales bacterium]
MDLGGPKGKPGRASPNMNVTPLVDVVLVLLIIFMVVTPLLMEGVDVQLPQTAKPEKMPEGAKQ